MNQRGLRTRGTNDFLGKLEHREFVRIADVRGEMRFWSVTVHQTVNAFEQVGAITECTRLSSVAENGQRLSAEGLADEGRHDSPIVQAHSGTIGVKNADNACGHSVLAEIGHREGFREALGFIITTSRADGVDVPPVAFRLRVNQGIPVDFGGRSEQESRTFGTR